MHPPDSSRCDALNVLGDRSLGVLGYGLAASASPSRMRTASVCCPFDVSVDGSCMLKQGWECWIASPIDVDLVRRSSPCRTEFNLSPSHDSILD
jgi:hypothetical protein